MTELRPLVVRNLANLEVDSIHSSSFCSFAILSSIWLISLSPLCTTSVSYSFTESNSISLSSLIWQIRCSILQGLVGDTFVSDVELSKNLCTCVLWRLYIPTYPYELTLATCGLRKSALFKIQRLCKLLRRVETCCADSQSTNPVPTFSHTEARLDI